MVVHISVQVTPATPAPQIEILHIRRVVVGVGDGELDADLPG
jgi:hypothetical protein